MGKDGEVESRKKVEKIQMIKLTALSAPTHKVYGVKEDRANAELLTDAEKCSRKSQDWECAHWVSTYLLFCDLYDLGPVTLPV